MTATLTVDHGPDQGQVYELADELVHIGRSADNQVVLSDRTLGEHQASIVRRNGRYAIYSPLAEAVQVDGNMIPAARWVWLPTSAQVQLGERTRLQFHNGEDATAETGESPTTERKARSRRSRKGRSKGSRRHRKEARKVARFITDQPGEPLVKLGEDGHLPELSLAEGQQGRQQANRKKSSSNPTLVYVAIALSFCCSVILLLVDVQPGGSSAAEKRQARQAIMEFYGDGDEELEPYQRLLRKARLAHSRGDNAAERRAYRRVLELLNSEDNNRFTGLTGSRQRDERLRKLTGILLSR